jgi:hypothetical protein
MHRCENDELEVQKYANYYQGKLQFPLNLDDLSPYCEWLIHSEIGTGICVPIGKQESRIVLQSWEMVPSN